jgi:hypothetical protein
MGFFNSNQTYRRPRNVVTYRGRRYHPYEEMLISLLGNIDEHRRQMLEHQLELKRLLLTEPADEDDPDLEKLWEEFTAAGGVTASDLRAWLDGEFTKRKVIQKKHLRLVRRRSIPRYRPRYRMRSRNGDGGEAA